MSTRGLGTHQLMTRLNGSPTYQESMAAPSGTGQARNSTAFAGGTTVMLQSSVAFYVKAGTVTSTISAAGADAVLVEANEKFVLVLKNDQTHVAVQGSGAAATVKAFVLE